MENQLLLLLLYEIFMFKHGLRFHLGGKRRMKIGGLLCFCFFLYDAYIPQQSLSMSSHWTVTFFDKSEVGEQKAHCDFR